jgi:hypothetical protein
MLSFSESATISGDLTSIWQTATEPAMWSDWDPHFTASGFEGPFQPGAEGWTMLQGMPGNTKGPFTVTEVADRKSFTMESPMPMGKMLIVNRFEVHGGFVPAFRLLFLKKMRRDIPVTFAALEQEAKRRSSEGGGR